MRWFIPLIGLVVASPVFGQPSDPKDGAADETLLRDHRLPTRGPDLLRILRDRIPSPEMIQQFHRHVARLKTAHYTERVRASADLTRMGPVVRPLLETYLSDAKADPETLARLRQVLDQFPAEKDHAIVAAAARLIARDQPAGSLPALLDFVPYAIDETVRQETQRAINAVAFVEKKPAALVLEALADPRPARHAAAGEALLRNAGLTARGQIAAILKDPHPLVRYQLGMALVEKHDKSGLPVLIESLPEIPTDRADQALELLYRVAGEHAPIIVYRGKADARACSAAWMQWYQKHQASLDLAKALAKSDLGFTIISCTGVKINTRNKIFELGPDKTTVRWEFDGPRYPIDLQVLGPNRILLAEYFDRRVTERDHKGAILWQANVAMPIACQRLPNGQTFIVSRQQIQIVDREGNAGFTWSPQGATISTAQRISNGQMVVVASNGRCQLLDVQGREIKGFQLGLIYTLGGNIEVLPNGRILAPLYGQNVVAEFDWQGKKLWQASVSRPISVTRLTNGHTLVTCSLDYRVVELDSAGKEVWSYQTEGRPFRARRR